MATCYELHLKDVLNQEEKREFASIARKEASKYKLAEPDALSYMNAAGQQLDALMVEEFKITSGFNLKSPEGTPAQEKTNVADHVKQGIPTFLNTGVDLFKFIVTKDNSSIGELYARFAKFVKKDKLSTNEQAAIKDFQSFISKYINVPIDKPGFFNDTSIEGVKEIERATALLNADLFRQLTYKTKPVGGKRITTEAVKAALGYAAYKALADLESTTHFKTEDEMERIHGSAPIVPFNKAQTTLKDMHLPVGTAINNWGEYAFNALGLSAVKGGSPNMVANLKTALGAQVVQLLRNRNILHVKSIDAETYFKLFNAGDFVNTSGSNQRFFYTLEKNPPKFAPVTSEQIKSLIDNYLTANKGSGGIIDKVFTGTTNVKEILYKPSEEITTETTTGMAVPKKMQEVQAKVQSTQLEFEASQADLMYGMSRVPMREGISFAQALVGIKTQSQISKYHKTQRAGIEATNESLQKGLDILNEYIDSSYAETTVLPVFLKMDVWKMLRAGTTSSALDPTGQKIHRYSLIGKDWVNEVRFDDKEMVDTFLLRVAEGLDIATDKKSNKTNLEAFNDKINTPVIQDAIAAIQSKDPAQYDRIIDAVDFINLKGGERVKTFAALVAYANYLTARETPGQETFEASLMGEVDGVSNGPMLTLLLAGLTVGGLSQEELFAKGGFFVDGENKDFNVYRGTGVPDLYEHVSQRMLDAIRVNFPTSNSFMDSVGYFSGKKTSTGAYELTTRKNIKSAVNPIMFGSAVFNAVRGLFNTFIDGIYDKIAEVNSMEAGQEKEAAVTELNKQLLSLDLIDEVETIEALLEDFEIKPKEYEDLWNQYYSGTNPKVKFGLGSVIGANLTDYFKDYLEKRNRVTKITNDSAKLYIDTKTQVTNKALEDAGITFSKEKINVGLSQEQNNAIDKQMMEAGITPVMHNMWSQEEGDINAGLLLLKKYKGQTNNIQYGTTVTGSKPFLTGDARHMAARSKGPIEAEPGTLSASVPTHSMDGFISFTRMLELFKQGITSFNMHDSGGTVFSKMREMAIQFNKVTFYSLVKYAPAYSIAEMAVRNVEGIYKLHKDGTIEADLFALESQISQVEELLTDASVGTRAKLDFLSTVKHVSQYALEGGSYEVTDADRKMVADQIASERERDAALHARLVELRNGIGEDIQAAKPKEENRTVTSLEGFTNHSGGAIGADTAWDSIGKEFGLTPEQNKHYYFEGYKTPIGNTPISISLKNEADEKLIAANKTLGRKFPTSKEYVNNLLRRNWWQVKNADAVFAIASIADNKVNGGTGWAVHMAIAENKPVYVFDQTVGKWFTWSGAKFEETTTPQLTKNFAGIGTREINDVGKQAIKDVYQKTLGITTPNQTNTPTTPVEPETPATPEEAAAQADVPPNGEVPTSTPVSPIRKLFNELFTENTKYVEISKFLEFITKEYEYTSYRELAKLLGASTAKVYLINSIDEIENEQAKASFNQHLLNDKGEPSIDVGRGYAWNGDIYLNNNYLNGLLLEKPSVRTVQELLLHETIHTIITSYLNDKNNQNTDTYLKLQELFNIAKKADVVGTYKYELENIDEFVTYALTRKSFQTFLSTLTISNNSKEITKYYTNNVFTKFIETVAQIFQKFIKVTKDNKFDTRYTKDLNNVLLAVITQGSKLIQEASNNESKGNTVAAMRMSNGLNTHSTMEVFDALNTTGLDVATTNHLRGLLSTIVYKLHGAFGTLHANVMRNTPVDAVGIYQDALRSGDLPIATAIGNASLPMTNAEAFAVDQVAITLEGALNNPAMRKYTRALELMYEQANKELKPSDFGNNSQAANNIYKFIFDTPNTNQQSLIRFAALGLANKQVSDAFKKVNVVLPEVKIKNTLFSRLQWLFNTVIAFVTSKTTGIAEGASLDQNLERILKNLVASEAKYQAIANQPRKDNVFNVYLNKGMSVVGKQVTKAARSNFVRNNSIKNKGKLGDTVGTAMEIVGKAVDKTINGKIEEMVEGGMMARNKMFDGPLGISAGIINEMRNETNSNKKMSALARLVKHTEATREKMIEETSTNVLSMFKDNGSYLTKEQQNSVSDLLRTGIGVVGYTGTQVQEFITDHTKLDKEINEVLYKIRPLARKHTKFLAAKAEATGFWLTTGIGVDPTRIATNATMVIQMQGTPVENALRNQKDQLLPEVEKLISLYGLRHMQKDVLNTVLDTEISRGVDNGIDFVMRLHKRINQDAKETTFKDKEILMQHGYLPEVVNPNIDIKYVTATPNRTLAQNVAMYQKAGYVSYGLLGRDKAHTVPTMMLVNKNVPATRRLTSLLAVIDDNTKGTLLHDGDFSGPFARANTAMNDRVNAITKAGYAQWESKGFVFDRNFDKTLMVPLVNEHGKLVNARYMANTDMRNNVLERNNNFAYLLGKQVGTTYEKLASKEQNNLAIKGLKDLYDVQYTKSPKDYYFVGLNSTDKEYKEAYMLLPYAARQEIKRVWGTEGMFVRKDMLDLVFGYRKLTIGDAMLKSKAEQSAIIKGMNGIAEYVFARNGSADERYAARLKAANLMKVLQRGEEEIVTETKKTIVLRLAQVLFSNESSNISFLKLRGMGVFEALQEKGKALTALNVYRNQSEELNRLTMYLNTGTRVNEHPEFIKRVAWLQESMNKNPVKPLIDAGFMPTISEDVETISEDYSYKGMLISKLDEFANKNKLTKNVDALSSQLYMGENTGSFQFMKYSTQVSDFTARYALYVHLSKDKTMTEADRLSSLSTSFINYDTPSHRMMEALNSVGLLWFTKYVLRVQQPLWEAVKANPSTALMFMVFNYFTDLFTLVTDSSLVNRIYNPLKLGALEYPFVLDDIAVMQAISGGASLITSE